MANSKIDISLDGVGEKRRPSRKIDIPLDCDKGAAGITDKEFEFVNRHHEEYKEMRRRAREQGEI